MHGNIKLYLVFWVACLLTACGAGERSADSSKQEKKAAKPVLVTIAHVQNKPIEITETAIGSLEGLIDPTVASEIAARVTQVHVLVGQHVKKGQLIATLDGTDFGLQRTEAQAELARIAVLLDNQAKVVARNQTLVDKKFISQNVLDGDIAQQKALNAQLAGAEARIKMINHGGGKSRIVAPTDGVIEKRIVGSGDFVRVGDPIVQIVSNQRLRAHIPFPERMGSQIKPGLKVRLTTPTSFVAVESVVRELKPMIAETNRSVDVIADVIDQRDWQPGASVTGTVILGERPAALMVPEQSVVLRPAGEVVYMVDGSQVRQVVVKTGIRQNGLVEIVEGVKENSAIVLDGAGFLTDNATIKIASSKFQSGL